MRQLLCQFATELYATGSLCIPQPQLPCPCWLRRTSLNCVSPFLLPLSLTSQPQPLTHRLCPQRALASQLLPLPHPHPQSLVVLVLGLFFRRLEHEQLLLGARQPARSQRRVRALFLFAPRQRGRGEAGSRRERGEGARVAVGYIGPRRHEERHVLAARRVEGARDPSIFSKILICEPHVVLEVVGRVPEK